MRNRGIFAWALFALLLTFYLLLYYTEIFTVFARTLWSGADKWTLYGALYTLAVIIGGVFVLRKNRRSPYQVRRTLTIIGVQLCFAFFIPMWMRMFTGKDFYFSYLWPLKIEYFYPSTIFQYSLPFALYSFIASLVIAPLLGFFFGKRWYCSWVCGCGGLANTAGDPFRHLSSKTRRSWRLEMVTIHTVLILALMTTAVVLINWGIGKDYPRFAHYAFRLQSMYGLFIGAFFSGIIGVSFYPLLGTRVWCRFGCPMAALLGLLQKFSRYQISVQPELCISCGQCSTYCEMGIDVRGYAMRGESFKRASCVGCGICSHVCPRGVLKLENKPLKSI